MNGLHQKQKSRFTLIEMLVAMLILGLVMAVISVSFYAIFHSYDRLTDHTEMFEDKVTLDRTLDMMLPNIIPFTWRDETKNQHQVFRGYPDQVIFAYLHPLHNTNDGSIRFVVLSIDNSNLVAHYCERPPFPENLDEEKVTKSILARGVQSIEFQYGDIESEELVFIEDWGEKDYVPLAIHLLITWEDGSQERWLKRTGGSSYYRRWGRWEQKDRL